MIIGIIGSGGLEHSICLKIHESKKTKKIYSNGGRVLNFVCLSSSFKESRDKIIKNIDKLNWKHGFFRKDIGYKVINK